MDSNPRIIRGAGTSKQTSSSRPPLPRKDVPTAPSLAPPVLKDVVIFKGPASPPPMPPAANVAFPEARHRSEKRYGRSKHDVGDHVDPLSQMKQFNEGKIPQNVPVADPMPDNVLHTGMITEGSLIAASAVMLRSRVSSQRSGALDRLLDLKDVATELADSNETCAAQFILALRLALDSPGPSLQSDVIKLIERLTERRNELEWQHLLESTSEQGFVLPVQSWLSEKTLFGVGECLFVQSADPTAPMPTSNPWEAIESIHELASVAKCEISDCFARTQYGGRLLYLLTNPTECVPWVPAAILRIFCSLSASRTAAEALSAIPDLMETLIKIAAPELSSPDILQLSELALLVILNLAKANAEVPQILKELGAFQKAQAIVTVTAEYCTSNDINNNDNRHLRNNLGAALRLLRVGVLTQHCSRHCVPGLFSSISLLVRSNVEEAIRMVEAHALVYGLNEITDGKQMVGLLDFVLNDCLDIFTDIHKQGRCEENMAILSSLMNVLRVGVQCVPLAVTGVQQITGIIKRILEVSIPELLPFEKAYVFTGSSKSRENAVRWPLLTDDIKKEISVSHYLTTLVKFCIACFSLQSPIVKTSITQVAEKLLQCGSNFIPEDSLSSQSQEHATLSKADSRIHSSMLRSFTTLLVQLAALKQLCASESDSPSIPLLFNLSLFILPSDFECFSIILDVIMTSDRYPKLRKYFSGTFKELVGERDGLYLRFNPGRLEPQLEWPFVITADVPELNREGRMLTVNTDYGISKETIEEWGKWLSAIVGADTFLKFVDWRELVLRCISCFATASEESSVLQDVVAPFLSFVIQNRHVDQTKTTTDKTKWELRMQESPYQILKRILNSYEADYSGNALYSAACLLFLDGSFPKEFPAAVMQLASTPQLCHTLGTSLRVGKSLYLGSIVNYLGDEDPSSEEVYIAARILAARGLNPTNMIHLRCLHQITSYVFEDDNSLSFTADEILRLLPSEVLQHVIQHDCSLVNNIVVDNDSLVSSCKADQATIVARTESIGSLNLPAFSK
eukprot:TRINITY_DN15592_c0_g1_i1.p1 TRINITY_DN15592_c0_g1~~TRINITY_DN15592_c0_g1_i1.p1  ORF type:complete len:1026 (+),score=170.61 TRINITY_DN15592_c0_g1_i1:38-3115(+)